MGDELVELFERACIKQQIDALTRCQLAGGVLLFQRVFAAALFGQLFKFGESRLRMMGSDSALPNF